MPIIVSDHIKRKGDVKVTSVPSKKVEECLGLFKERIELERIKEAQLFSFPSDKTRIRILE